MVKILLLTLFIFNCSSVFPAPDTPSLKEFSEKMNSSLPEVFDHATKLMTTTVDNNNFNYHFVLNATKDEFKFAFPKVKTQILKTICSRSQERSILKNYKANIVYRYETLKGETLGQFMVKPEHCMSKR